MICLNMLIKTNKKKKDNSKKVKALMKKFMTVLRKMYNYKGNAEVTNIIKFSRKQSSKIDKQITSISEEFIDMVMYGLDNVRMSQIKDVEKQIWKLAIK